MASYRVKIIDVKDMPGFKPYATGQLEDSVTRGKVYVQKVKHGWFPYCKEHGAMLKVSKFGMWRCAVCHEGCYQVPPGLPDLSAIASH